MEHKTRALGKYLDEII